jgi:hypothetical protein
MTEKLDHLHETLELLRDQVTWMFQNDWTKEFFKTKLREFDALLAAAQGEVADLLLINDLGKAETIDAKN